MFSQPLAIIQMVWNKEAVLTRNLKTSLLGTGSESQFGRAFPLDHAKALHGRFAESGLVAMVTLYMRSTVSRDEVYNACSCVYVHRKVQCVAISARETKHFRVKIASKTGLCPH